MKEERDRIKQIEVELSIVEERAKVHPEDARLIKILCLGDSWTLGTGASPGYSYPAQLQKIFDKQYTDKYKVYNAGIPGCTSTRLLKYLPKLLKNYKPDIVIILIGKNDMNNPYPSELILISGWPKKCYFLLKGVILDLRVYKVLRLGLDGLRQKFIVFKKYKADTIKDINPESNKYAQIGFDLFNSDNFELAKDYFEKAIAIDSDNERAYLHLGHLYQFIGQYDKALIMWKRLLEIKPYTSLRKELYRFLFWAYQNENSPRDKIGLLIKNIPSDEIFKNPGMAFILNNELIIKSLKHNLARNLEKIINLIKSKGALPIIQTYCVSYLDNKLTYNYLKDITQRYDIPLIDNTKIFEKLVERKSYFATDGHPNEKGYLLIAENIYETLKEEIGNR